MEPDLSVTVHGIRFKNPLVVAPATPTGGARYLRRCFESGAGAVVVKSVSDITAHQDYIRPRFTILNRNAYPWSFSNYSSEFAAWQSVDEWMADLKLAKGYADEHGAVLIGSIFSASTVDRWVELAKMQEDIGCELIELDFGCPNVTASAHSDVALDGAELGANPQASAEITHRVVSALKIPVYCKLTSEGCNPVTVARACKAAGAHGMVVLNRTPSLDIDVETGRPLLGGGYAGVGGPWMLPIMLKWVVKVIKETGLPVSATSGIWRPEDVTKAIMCGAHTVQTCTAIMYGTRGYGVVEYFLKGMRSFMRERNIPNLDAIRGITIPQIRTFPELLRIPKENIWAEVRGADCTGCGLCPHWCYYDAITLDADKKAAVDPDLCDGCGLCVVLCPADAFDMKTTGETYYLGPYQPKWKRRTHVDV